MWFLIGSRAINELTQDFYRDISKSDLDLYCSKEDFQIFISNCKDLEKCYPLKKDKYRIKIKDYPIIELKIYSEKSVYHWLSQSEQKELLSEKTYKLGNIEVNIPNLKCLKSIKQSHLYWPISWLKNIEDFTWLKEKTNLYITKEKDALFLKMIKSEMKEIHGKIPSGKIKDISKLNEINIKDEVINLYDKTKIIYFIHEKLSLKNKIRIINHWNDFKHLLEEKNSKNKIKY